MEDSRTERSCATCNRPDSADDMVACDSCLQWFHYSCAKVDAGVKNREWYCSTCEPLLRVKSAEVSEQLSDVSAGQSKPDVPLNGQSKLTVPEKEPKKGGKSAAGSKTSRKTKKTVGEKSVTSSVRARLAMELKVLEEQQRIQEEELAAEKELKDLRLKHEQELQEKQRAFEAQKLADEKAFLERKMAEEQDYRKQQMAIRKQSLEEKAKLVRQMSERGSSAASGITSVPDSREIVEKWLEISGQQTAGVIVKSTSAVHPAVIAQQGSRGLSKDVTSAIPKTNVGAADTPFAINSDLSVRALFLPTQTGTVPVVGQQLAGMNLKENGRHEIPEENIGFSASNVRAHTEIHPQGMPGNRQDECWSDNRANTAGSMASGGRRVAFDAEEYDGPTNRQLAARQVMGKDLPPFSGRPEEWPLWFSNFQRSTTTCGFSEDENLIRLQRCLKGEALDTVRSKLLCPSSVPHVIRTLEMRYGRPGTLIRVMTERIRQLPSPRINDLNSIIEFGLAVDSLVEHLRNSGEQSHLNNPSLLHDLVAKLPVDYRMKWAAYKSTLRQANLTAFGSFMSTMVELAYEVADDFIPVKSTKPVNQPKPKEQAFLQAHSESSAQASKNDPSSCTNERTVKKSCVFCKAEGHKIVDCSRFKQMSIDERLKVVQMNGLCRTCLNQHGRWPCKSWKECEIQDCRMRHHTLLHSTSEATNMAVLTNHLGEFQSLGGPLSESFQSLCTGTDAR